MGSGKSSVGRLVAGLLDYSFLDTDQLIEEQTGKTISQLFAENGEVVFRDLERDVVAGLEQRRRTVVSTGGGLPVFEPNLTNLRKHSLVVCLWAGAESLYERVRGHSHRPLLQAPDPLGKIRDLLAAREPFYRQADILVNTEQRSLREVAQQVLHHYHNAQSAVA